MGNKKLLYALFAFSLVFTKQVFANPVTTEKKYEAINPISGTIESPKIYILKADKVITEDEKLAQLRVHLNALNLLKDTSYPQSIKIDLYRLQTSNNDRKTISLTTKTITSLKEAKSLGLALPLDSLAESNDIYLDLYNSSGTKIATYKTFIQIDSAPISQERALANANCGNIEFGECQLNYLLNNIKFEVSPRSSLSTLVKKEYDGTYTVSMPVFSKKSKIQRANTTVELPDDSTQGLINSSILNFTNEANELQASLSWNSLTSKIELLFKDKVQNAFSIDREGHVNIGTEDTNAYLSIKGGDGQNASLKINPGTLTSTPIDGALEFDGEKLYFTASGSRTQIGARGPQGPMGPTGPQGLPGPAGTGLSTGSIVSNLILNGTTLFNSNSIAQFNGEIIIPNGATAGYVLTSDANGKVSWQASGGGGGGGDAATFDSLDSTSFLRSDTTDNFTSGVLIFNSGTRLDVNGDLSIADTDISLDGASTTFTQTTGAINMKPATGFGIHKAVPRTLLDVNGTITATSINGSSANFTNLNATNIAGSGALITGINGSHISHGIVSAVYGGSGVSNSGTITFGANDIAFTGDDITLNASGATSVTLPTSGTLSTLAGTEVLTNKTLTSPVLTTPSVSGLTTFNAGAKVQSPTVNGTTLFRDSSILQINGSLLIPDNASTGYILTSDANGSASWQANAGGSGKLTAASNLSDLANAATARTNLGLAIGTNVQAHSANLDLLAAKAVPSGTIVGSSDTQTLTNKTLTSPTLTTPVFSGLATFNPGAALESPTVNGTLASDVYVNSSIPTNTSGATITVDWNRGNIQTLTLDQVGTTINFTNPSLGYGRFTTFVKQDATGSRTVTTWDTDIRWPGGSAPVLSTAANAVDIISCIWDGTNYYCQIGLDFD